MKKKCKRTSHSEAWIIAAVLFCVVAALMFLGTTKENVKGYSINEADLEYYFSEVEVLKKNSAGIVHFYKPVEKAFQNIKNGEELEQNLNIIFESLDGEIIPYFAAKTHMAGNTKTCYMILYTKALSLQAQIYMQIRNTRR